MPFSFFPFIYFSSRNFFFLLLFAFIFLRYLFLQKFLIEIHKMIDIVIPVY